MFPPFCWSGALASRVLPCYRSIWAVAAMGLSTQSGTPSFQRFVSKNAEISPGFVVRRIIPQVKCRAVGPFVFLDHFGPATTAMDVGPHPHIGLSTLTYLYEGAILHRDSTGVEQPIIPNQVNWMCSGKGVTHSERPMASPTGTLHGLQLWVGLPKDQEDVDPIFHHSPSIEDIDLGSNDGSVEVKLVVGTAWGYKQENIPLVRGLEDMFLVSVEFGNPTKWECPPIGKESSTELGIYVSSGSLQLKGVEDPMEVGDMVVTDASQELTMEATSADTKVAILGGTPFKERKHLLWNFCSWDRDKLQEAADAWTRLDRSVFPPVVNESNEDSIPLRKK